MWRFVLIVTRLGKVYISFHSNSGFWKIFTKYYWAVGFSTLSISCILYSSLLFSFSKQWIWCFLIKWCYLIIRSLIPLLHSKNVSFQARGIAWIICLQKPNLSFKPNFAFKSFQLLILTLFSKRSPIWLRIFWEK